MYKEVVGSSPTRGELFSKKFRFGVLFMAHTHIHTSSFHKTLKNGSNCHIYNTNRVIGTEICGMDYVFPPDDLLVGSDNKNTCTCICYIYIYINLIIDMAGCYCLISNYCTKIMTCACSRLKQEWSCGHAIKFRSVSTTTTSHLSWLSALVQ